MTLSIQILPNDFEPLPLARAWHRRPWYAARLFRFLRANDIGDGYGMNPKLHRIIVATVLTAATLLLCDPVLEVLDSYEILPVSRLLLGHHTR